MTAAFVLMAIAYLISERNCRQRIAERDKAEAKAEQWRKTAVD